MELLLFRTDIKSTEKVKYVQPLLNDHIGILDWSIDLEDIDNVLRIEASTQHIEEDIIGLVRKQGFYIKTLAD